MLRAPETIEKNVDVLVIGGGLPGVCAAIEAARGGARVALVERGKTLGGNCGPEVGVHPSDAHRFHPYMASTGVVGRLIEEAAYQCAKTETSWFHYNISQRWDSVMAQALRREGVEILRNHYAHTPEVEDGRITAVWCEDTATYKRVRIAVNTAVIDDSGDGNVAERAGASWRMGREARSEYGERMAPEQADSITMGSSVVCLVHKTDHPVTFTPPEGTPPFFPGYAEEVNFNPGENENLCFFFPCETGGEGDTIEDEPELYDRLMGMIYSAWNRVKNEVAVEAARNWEILWISPRVAKRESRRFIGDYVLTSEDCESGRIFEDAIAVGGFALDIHYPRPETPQYVKIVYFSIPPVYTIPYRCIYSKDIRNLFFASRLLSVTHKAHGSVRLQRTLATIGQAAGAAAALCKKTGLEAREIYTLGHVPELQQILLKEDASIPGIVKVDEADRAPLAQVSADSELHNVVPEEAAKWETLSGKKGVELWNFDRSLRAVKFKLKNSAPRPVRLSANVYRFSPPRRYLLNHERKFFAWFEHHNEAEWGGETRLDWFEHLAESSAVIPAHFEGTIPFRFELDLKEKDPMNDDDRIAIILNEQPEVSMAVRDELMDFERCIEDVQENLYVVSPRAPVCEIFPRPLYGEASQAVRGVNRRFSTNPINMWRPAVLPATLTLRWDQEFAAGELRMTFDTLTRAAHEMPFECNERASGMLARHYLVELFSKGNSTARIEITDNYNRLNILNFHGAVCDEMRLTLMETWKESCLPGVYDIRLYSNQG